LNQTNSMNQIDQTNQTDQINPNKLPLRSRVAQSGSQATGTMPAFPVFDGDIH
jgi:hypothetical protein